MTELYCTHHCDASALLGIIDRSKFDPAYCIKTSSKRTHPRVKTQSLSILSCLSRSPHISWLPFLPDLSSIPSATYRKDAPVSSSVRSLTFLDIRKNRGFPLCRVLFAALCFVASLQPRLRFPRVRSRLSASRPAARPVGSPFPRDPRGSLRRHPAPRADPRGSALCSLRGSSFPRGTAGRHGDAENRGTAGSGDGRGGNRGNAEPVRGAEPRKTAGSRRGGFGGRFIGRDFGGNRGSVAAGAAAEWWWITAGMRNRGFGERIADRCAHGDRVSTIGAREFRRA